MTEYNKDSAVSHADRLVCGLSITGSELDSLPESELECISDSLHTIPEVETIPTSVPVKIELLELKIQSDRGLFSSLSDHTYNDRYRVFEKLNTYIQRHQTVEDGVYGLIIEVSKDSTEIRLHKVDEPISVPSSNIRGIYPCPDKSVARALEDTQVLTAAVI